MQPASVPLREIIIGEIRANGPIPFARFMDLCLYHPRCGYYARGIGGGSGRDYLTSSGVHRAFGALVARQAEEMWRGAGCPGRFAFIEYGPGEGWFALDFLREAALHREFARALQYMLIEPSAELNRRQRSRLADPPGGIPVAWIDHSASRAGGVRPEGCVFANEVVDAFPVHRVIGSASGPLEVHVGVHGSELSEILLPPSTPGIGRFLARTGVDLEDGQEVDLNLAAAGWIAEALGRVSRGYLVVVDYGYEAAELYRPERRRGTLMAYHRHRASEDFLMRPGDQDLTAHIDFSALRDAVSDAGGRCLGLVPQSHFLLALGALGFMPEFGRPGDSDPAAPGKILQDREALKDLVLPDRMGGRFKLLVAAVGNVPDRLSGLLPPWESEASLNHAEHPAAVPNTVQADARR